MYGRSQVAKLLNSPLINDSLWQPRCGPKHCRNVLQHKHSTCIKVFL